jgi:hypothetical protein
MVVRVGSGRGSILWFGCDVVMMCCVAFTTRPVPSRNNWSCNTHCIQMIASDLIFLLILNPLLLLLSTFTTYPAHIISSPSSFFTKIKEYTLEKCKILAEKASSVNDLPYQCKRYPEAVKAVGHPSSSASTTEGVKRQETEGSKYAGMQGGLAAQANKKKGLESHAQIQRRLTNTRRFTKQA